jgi:methionyl-tRNA formyltransferase
MDVFLMGNGPLAAEAIDILREGGDRICGVAVHPSRNDSLGREQVLDRASVPSDTVFDGSTLERPDVVELIARLGADVALSVKFGYILRPAFLDRFPGRVFNLHTSLLPSNRGAYPNVWAIVDGTPAGVSLHVVDDGIDTGPLLAQAEVPVLAWDTGASLYTRLDQAAAELLRGSWSDVAAGRLTPRPQTGRISAHHTSDVGEIDEIDLSASYRASRLLDIIRARTFPGHDGAFFTTADGVRVNLRLQLEPDLPAAAHD